LKIQIHHLHHEINEAAEQSAVFFLPPPAANFILFATN